MTKRNLFERGQLHIFMWCNANRVTFYRSGVIYISVRACAEVGRAGRAWSWPGYTVDRTPFGVLSHELGHHVEGAHGASGGVRAPRWMEETREPAITSYAPNANEWFAEMFRVFITNPDLLRLVRPRVHALMVGEWQPIETRSWRDVLSGSARHLTAAERKIATAPRARDERLFA